VQATAAGLAMSLGGIFRDVIASWWGALAGYEVVYGIEILLLLGTLALMAPLMQTTPPLSNDPRRHP
jgi:BCD family chlorophyll transporter-like MFS transporter